MNHLLISKFNETDMNSFHKYERIKKSKGSQEWKEVKGDIGSGKDKV